MKKIAHGRAAEKSVPISRIKPVVVGIGASAGGLDSISSLLREVPDDTGFAYIVIQHLGPRQSSMLPSIFARTTTMPVKEITAGMRIEPNHVYVCPPGHDIYVQNNALGLSIREKRTAIDGQIDKFMSSLASECGPRAVGVILSGSGSDGTRGMREIKGKGGITFAESKSSAQFPDMPQSAINSGAVDHVQPSAAIGHALGDLALSPRAPPTKESNSKEIQILPPSAFQRIFRILRTVKKADFSEYKQTTIRRRILRRMMLMRIREIDDYVVMIQNDPKEVDRLFHDLLINVTGFFRDASVFRALEKSVLPKLILDKGGQGELRIWVPGCATGQEVYSVAICVVEALARLKSTMHVQIFGTDLSEIAIEQARQGVYPASSLREMTPPRRKRYFTRKDGSMVISRSIRDLCTFAQQNLVADPPFSRLDLVTCRNVLIYFGPNLQKRCLPQFFYALNPNGVLILGEAETIGNFANLFSLMDKKNKIYRKKVTSLTRDSFLKNVRQNSQDIETHEEKLVPHPKSAAANAYQRSSPEIQAAADQLILTHFAPGGAVIDNQLQVWHFRGDTAPFLKQPTGAATLNILKLVCRGIAAELSAAIHMAIKTREPVLRDIPSVATNAGTRNVHLDVVPFTVAHSTEPWLLVIFETRDPGRPAASKTRGKPANTDIVRENGRLREELKSTRESLQSIIEAQESASETIRSANEEIESSNEELQSTNEELETAKEELQSTNEELSTVNDELNNRNLEITEINNDLNDLLSSINIAVVRVDNALTIRRATPLAEKLFNIIPSDVGRRLSDINPNFSVPSLPKLVLAVIDDLIPCIMDVRDNAGTWYSLRIRPYRTRKNIIDGVVITLVDIRAPQGKSGTQTASEQVQG